MLLTCLVSSVMPRTSVGCHLSLATLWWYKWSLCITFLLNIYSTQSPSLTSLMVQISRCKLVNPYTRTHLPVTLMRTLGCHNNHWPKHESRNTETSLELQSIKFNKTCNTHKQCELNSIDKLDAVHLEDHHFGTEESKLMSKSTRSTQRLKSHVSQLHLHNNPLQYQLSMSISQVNLYSTFS